MFLLLNFYHVSTPVKVSNSMYIPSFFFNCHTLLIILFLGEKIKMGVDEQQITKRLELLYNILFACILSSFSLSSFTSM